MERKQIFYLNEIKFTCDFVENLSKTSELSCYTLQDTKDFTYLINDLKPLLIIIDSKLYSENKDEFWSQIKQADIGLKTMIVGASDSDFDFSYPGAIDATHFANEVRSKLE